MLTLRAIGRVMAVIVFSVASALPAAAVAPTGTPVRAELACRADSPIRVEFRLTEDGEVFAPARVRPGAKFVVVATMPRKTLPRDVYGVRLREVRDVALRLQLPSNAAYVTARLEGGDGLGAAPSLERSGAMLTVKVPGPIAGGASFQPPRVIIGLRAGRSGVVETRLHGSGYDDPALRATGVIKTPFGSVKAKVSCYGDPNPILSRTVIG